MICCANGLVSERVFAANGAGRSLWYAYDVQGACRALTDASGQVADTYQYLPYGTLLTQTGSDYNPFRYGGQAGYYTDQANTTGTLLCGLRWYAPSLGRWLSRDPIGYAGEPNLYEYCASNPVMGIDPTGTDVWVITWGGGFGLGSHAAIAMNYPDERLPRVFDFGPRDETLSPLGFLFGGYVDGEVMWPATFDPLNPHVPSHTLDNGKEERCNSVVHLKTTTAQDKAIRRWLLKTITNDPDNNWLHNSSYGRYNGCYNQCSTYVRDALNAGSLAPNIWNPFGNVLGGPLLGAKSVDPANLRNWSVRNGGQEVFSLGNWVVGK